MRALSIRQPWAFLICHGYKDIENRTWPLPHKMVGQRIYVHASKTSDESPGFKRAYACLLQCCKPTGPSRIWETMWRELAYGAIVGEVDIVGCVGESDSPWFEGPYGFALSNPIAYPEPIPYRGRLGFFEVELPQREE